MDKNEKNIWTADHTNPELADKLRHSLREVYDPEIGLSVIQLGLIREVIIKSDKAEITMILTTPFCPYAPALIDITKKKAEGILNMPTTVELGIQMWDFSMMEEGTAPDWGLY